jgi:hypothetical protein
MNRRSAKQIREIDSTIRPFLIAETFRFIAAVSSIAGVEKIAIIGSLTTDKPEPKDADVLITVTDDLDLSQLAAAARKLKGAAQTRNKGADIFLANPAGEYIGRVCQWRECAPGIRVSCDARRCGRRHYLHDDFDDIKLSSELVAEPPVEVWPQVVCRKTVPADVMSYLSAP